MTKFNTVEAIELPESASSTMQAYAKGFNRAIKLDSGDQFFGALDVADQEFEDRASFEHAMYCSGYLAGIDQRFPNGVIPCVWGDNDTSFIQ